MKTLFVFLSVYIFISINVDHLNRLYGQTITKIAGSGTEGYNGDTVEATAAFINDPCGITVDHHGNLYFADQLNHRIRRITPSALVTIAGDGTPGYGGDGGPATAAELNLPYDAVFDRLGNMYIADHGYSCVRKVNTSGIMSTFAGIPFWGFGYSGDGGAATDADLGDVRQLAIDTSGNIYISDDYFHCIRKVNTSGIITTFAGTGGAGFGGDGGPASSAVLNNPLGIAVDRNNNVYFADSYNQRIRKVTPAGIISTFAGTGAPGFSGDGSAATAAQLDSPSGIAIDRSGNMYIADTRNQRIRKIASGIITTIAGTGVAGYNIDSGAATAAQFYNPTGIAVDSIGNIFVTDYFNNVVRKISGGHLSVWPTNTSPSESITIYPNPSKGNFTIRLNGYSTTINVCVFNALGKLIFENNSDKHSIPVDITRFGAGVYSLKIKTDGTNYDSKIVISP